MSKKLQNFLPIVAIAFFFPSILFSDTNRPECGIDVSGSGVCFIDSEESTDIWLVCENNGVEVGGWLEIGTADNDFLRINPDGTLFVHNSERDVFALFCSPETIADGYCDEGGGPYDYSQWYMGLVTWQAGGLLDYCPFVMTSRGEVTRAVDGDTLQVHMKYQTVPDDSSPTGCRIKKCEIFKRGQFDVD
jgi:hypothetical protein